MFWFSDSSSRSSASSFSSFSQPRSVCMNRADGKAPVRHAQFGQKISGKQGVSGITWKATAPTHARNVCARDANLALARALALRIARGKRGLRLACTSSRQREANQTKQGSGMTGGTRSREPARFPSSRVHANIALPGFTPQGRPSARQISANSKPYKRQLPRPEVATQQRPRTQPDRVGSHRPSINRCSSRRLCRVRRAC